MGILRAFGEWDELCTIKLKYCTFCISPTYDCGLFQQDSLASVEDLIKKHESFEKTFEAQGNKIEQLEVFGGELLQNDHYDSEGIRRRLKVVTDKRDNLKNKAKVRARTLDESKSLQQFLRNVYEVEGWISEKLQVACDESYRDPTNLQSKIQKHGAFEAEVLANSGRVTAVTHEGTVHPLFLAEEHSYKQELLFSFVLILCALIACNQKVF